jgi:hypothetical protein
VALDFCDSNGVFAAKYMAIAIEVNIYCDRTSRADYEYFIENVYIPIYDAIKVMDNSIKD